MRRQFLSGTIALLLLSGGGFASAEDNSGARGQPRLRRRLVRPTKAINSSSSMKLRANRRSRCRRRACAVAPSGFDGRVGNKAPDSTSPYALPGDQVPETKGLLFVRLPDRVLLIDHAGKVIEIVADVSKANSDAGGSNRN
jgi:hypothetical protein